MVEAALDFLPEGSRVLEDEIVWTGPDTFKRIAELPVTLPGPCR